VNAKVALAAAGGHGIVAHRGEAVLFVPAATWPGWSAMCDQFVDQQDTATAVAALLDRVQEEDYGVDGFMLIDWSAATTILVFGDIEVTSDHRELASLSGRSSSTWVEHRMRRPQPFVLRCGAPVNGPSRFTGGIVPADGIEVALHGMPAPDEPSSSDVRPADATPQAAAPPPVAPPAAHDGWSALQAAAGDWMEDSVGLPPPTTTSEPAGGSTEGDSADATERDDDTGVAVGDAQATPAPASRPAGPPPRPAFDPEMTLDPDLVERPRTAPAATVPTSHGVLVLPDGRPFTVTGTVVVGRQPDTEAARVTDAGAVLLALDVGKDVSRTHLVVRASGSSAEVVDCASSGHTVLLAAGSDDPTMLEPWVPYELTPGDVLYLGGPTQLRFER
jgi:hypothetical protein